MKVYTRGGDDGSTALADGGRVAKADGRVAACGEVDELNAVLGVLREAAGGGEEDSYLRRSQCALFDAGAYLADPSGRYNPGGDLRNVSWIEKWIDAMDGELAPLQAFILPAGTRGAVLAHQARAVCRRAERAVVDLGQGDRRALEVVPLLNRLSDALFVLGRWLNHRQGVDDVAWRRDA